MKLLVLIVSHAHGVLAERCVQQVQEGLSQICASHDVKTEVVLIHNVPESNGGFKQPIDGITEIWNTNPVGFGVNHNQIFLRRGAYSIDADWLLIANPDLDWRHEHVFETMARSMHTLDANIGAASLKQVSSQGEAIDYLRKLITPWQLLQRAFHMLIQRRNTKTRVEHADWFNGASMLVRKQAFEQVQGFDKRFHMYCEDTDLCIRLQLAGWKLALLDAEVTHEGRRSSRRSAKYFLMHVNSLARLWTSSAFWRYLRIRKASQIMVVPAEKRRASGLVPSYYSR